MYKLTVDFSAHLHTSDPDAHPSDDLQVVQDEFLQLSDAASLKKKLKATRPRSDDVKTNANNARNVFFSDIFFPREK